MNRVIKTIRNLIFICILLAVFLATTGLRFTPTQAHITSEKSIHYGPSNIVKIFDYEKYQHFLCTYDKWVSCNTVRRKLLFFWTVGGQTTGFENDISKEINYSYSWTRIPDNSALVYGIVNNTNITKIELYATDGSVFIQDELYDNLFYFSWQCESTEFGVEKIIGYDENDKEISEIVFPN